METKICKKSTIAAVKKAKKVFGYVKLSDGLGTYVQLDKDYLLECIQNCDEGDLYSLNIRFCSKAYVFFG